MTVKSERAVTPHERVNTPLEIVDNLMNWIPVIVTVDRSAEVLAAADALEGFHDWNPFNPPRCAARAVEAKAELRVDAEEEAPLPVYFSGYDIVIEAANFAAANGDSRFYDMLRVSDVCLYDCRTFNYLCTVTLWH